MCGSQSELVKRRIRRVPELSGMRYERVTSEASSVLVLM